MTEKYGSFGNFDIAYLCSRTGDGFLVSLGDEPDTVVKSFAHAMMINCEVEATCPPNCSVRGLIKEIREKGGNGLLF